MIHKQKKSWFLAQLKPNSVQIAYKNLKRQGFETFLPMEEVVQRQKGKFRTSFRPLFRGYIFVAFDITQGLWRAVNSTHGITRLVSFGSKPAEVPHDLMSQLILRCSEEGNLLPTERLEPGDYVRLMTGPFADYTAKIEEITPDQRVWVLLDIMGRKTRTNVAANQLRGNSSV
jgi:transcriptional antiterminator RfaH